MSCLPTGSAEVCCLGLGFSGPVDNKGCSHRPASSVSLASSSSALCRAVLTGLPCGTKISGAVLVAGGPCFACMRMLGLLVGMSAGACSREAAQSASNSAAACARYTPASEHSLLNLCALTQEITLNQCVKLFFEAVPARGGHYIQAEDSQKERLTTRKG
jgi:hypothetical protein